MNGLLAGRVALEGAGGRKLAELVADHVLRNINGQEAAAVVHVEVKSDKVGRDRRAARPGLDRLAVVVGLSDTNLFCKMGIDKESFFYGTRHSWLN